MKVTNKSTVRVGAAGVAVIGIIVLFLVMFAVERIDSGQTGIIVNLAGSERGVDDAKVETGWVTTVLPSSYSNILHLRRL